MTLIYLESITLGFGEKKLIQSANLEINKGECILVSGASGSGKTTLCEAIVGKIYTHGKIKNNLPNGNHDITYVSQYSSFKDKTGMSNFYYQQRFNSYDADNTISVYELLAQELDVNSDAFKYLVDLFTFSNKLNSSLLYLSSGERKKLQLIRSFMNPKPLLILDNPFIGLDKQTVAKFYDYLKHLLSLDITILIVANLANVPEFVTHVCEIKDKQLNKVVTNEYQRGDKIADTVNLADEIILTDTPVNYHDVVKLNNVAVSYGDKHVIKKVDWHIVGGSKWLLSGENGAGKSTLLSLINGDHPQAYANDITLFDARRGSGETIWDIKRKIGYVSPELHWNFDKSMSCLDTVLSGFFDTPGLYRRASDEQRSTAHSWLAVFELTEYADVLLANVSSGIQRYLLLARALVKNPPLFIFDEPCQGLDYYQTQKFINIIDKLFSDSNHTIIYVSHVADEIPQCITHKLHVADGLVAYSD